MADPLSTRCLTSVLPLAGLLLACVGAGYAANLVFDSSFESGIGAGTLAEGWDSGGTPPGGVNAVNDTRAHNGKFSHQITVPDAAPVNWYQVRQSIPMLTPGQTVTLSVYIRTENVRDGAGAYCSINCYSGADQRIGVFDAEAKVQGTATAWQRQVVTATIPAKTNRVVLILTVHGHGTAWFDDVQLEPGEQATDYGTSAVDREAAERAAAQKQAAEKLAASLHVPSGPRGTVAVLRDDLPADGCASSPERLGRWLSGAGYGVCFLNAEQLSNPFILRGPAAGAQGGPLLPFDLLILPYGGSFPATAAATAKNYLRQQGAFISTGGYAFDTLLVHGPDKWYKPEDLPVPAGGGVSLMDFSVPADAAQASWGLGSDPGGNKPMLKAVPGPRAGVTALEFRVDPLRLWATANHKVQERLPAPAATDGRRWTITRFWARGDANTPKMAFEWDEADGSRWKINLPLTREWKEYVLTPADFSYWHDNPSVGRGGAGDSFHPERATTISLGLALDIVARDEPHSFQFADLRVQADPLGDLRVRPKCLNTRVARIRDAMWPDPDQIPVFDPANMLQFVTGARPAANQFVATGAPWQGRFAGYSAVGILSNQGHGFGPNLTRIVPLLQATDRFGRNRGLLGSLLYHYDGFYRGSAAGIFGVTNTDLFTDANPGARDLLVNSAAALLRRVFLHDTDTEFSSYRPGETVRFRTKVSNYGRREAAVSVSLRLDAGPATPAKQLTLKPGATEDVTVELPADQLKPAALCHFAFTLSMDGQPVDCEENAVVLWRGERGPGLASLTHHGPYFTLGDRPMFLTGCQTYWGQNGSVTARSPLAFARDFAMMQDYGLHFSRLFVPYKTDSDRRQSDAMVQLAEQHRVVFYHTPNLHNTAVPEELAEETAAAKDIAERYLSVPWLMVDVCNEPTVGVADKKLTPAFNDFLRGKYGTTAALRQAWGDDKVELGQVKPAPLSDRWDDLRAYDTHCFAAWVQQHWADSNRAAIRAADPARLVSVGHMQNFGDGHRVWDPPICQANLDFSDRHYYGPPAGQPAQLRDIDQRVLGKPLVQGECGAKDHPTFASSDPWSMGDDDERYNQRFSYLMHHAFGLGAAALCSWHWRDPMEGIFPCGQVRSDRVPRPSASVMRALAFTFGRLRPVFDMPQVVLVRPDTHRLGGSRAAVTAALHRAEDMLVSCQVDFGVIGEARIGELPAQVKALVYPMPYCPPDEAVAALKTFVERGGALYFSGDISYDPQRKLTRTQRLVEL
ncbi:MAG: beta-galactosidase, partial [Armatimonadetes bacterium]|nr:beta-galactosidase [Armatimonadota bacterium]